MAEVFSISGAGDSGMGLPQITARQMAHLRRLRMRQPGVPVHPHHRHRRHRHHPRSQFFGLGASCPAGFTTTAKGNCQGPLATSLQTALRALGKAVGGDVSLMNLAVDGSIGPGTAAAVNRAFTTHVGPGQMPQAFRTGTLGIMDIAANAAQFAGFLNAETLRRGGSLTPAAAPIKPRVATSPSSIGPSTASMIPDGGGAPGLPMSTWGLVGLGLLLVGGGAYVIFSKPEPARARARR